MGFFFFFFVLSWYKTTQIGVIRKKKLKCFQQGSNLGQVQSHACLTTKLEVLTLNIFYEVIVNTYRLVLDFYFLAKFGIQTVFRKKICEQYARQTIQLVGLILELEFVKLEFRPKIQTIVAYMYPIVAFSINVAIGTKKTPLQCLLSSPKSSLANSSSKISPTNYIV